MSEINTGIDVLGFFLSGGAANRDPDACLGGVASSTILRPLGALVEQPPGLPAVQVLNIFANNGEGVGVLRVDENGDLRYTPPGGVEGAAVVIAAGESKNILGTDTTKGLRVTREAGLSLAAGATSNLMLRNAMNGVLAMKDVTSAQRVAGATTYRALFLLNQGVGAIENIRLWTPSTGGQATYSLAYEVPTGSTIQTIADELTAPTGVSWVTSTTEAGALTPPSLASGEYMGIWIRKVFPAVGTVAAEETVQLAMKFLG